MIVISEKMKLTKFLFVFFFFFDFFFHYQQFIFSMELANLFYECHYQETACECQ